MRVKDYLGQTRHLDGLIKARKEQLAELRDMSENIRVNRLSKMPRCKSQGDTISATVARLVDLELFIEASIERLAALKKDIALLVEGLPELELRRVLELRYLNCKKWEEIADDMSYNFRHVHRLHARALARLEEEWARRELGQGA